MDSHLDWIAIYCWTTPRRDRYSVCWSRRRKWLAPFVAPHWHSNRLICGVNEHRIFLWVFVIQYILGEFIYKNSYLRYSHWLSEGFFFFNVIFAYRECPCHRRHNRAVDKHPCGTWQPSCPVLVAGTVVRDARVDICRYRQTPVLSRQSCRTASRWGVCGCVEEVISEISFRYLPFVLTADGCRGCWSLLWACPVPDRRRGSYRDYDCYSNLFYVKI